MSRMRIEIYGTECEAAGLECNNGKELILEVDREFEDARVVIGECGIAVAGNKCVIPLDRIDDGVHTPELIYERGRIILPPIRKIGYGIYHGEPDGEYIRSTSRRVRELEKRIRELESEAEKLCRKIYGTTIF